MCKYEAETLGSSFNGSSAENIPGLVLGWREIETLETQNSTEIKLFMQINITHFPVFVSENLLFHGKIRCLLFFQSSICFLIEMRGLIVLLLNINTKNGRCLRFLKLQVRDMYG